MSDKGKTARAWPFYIDEMIGFAEKVPLIPKAWISIPFVAAGSPTMR